MSVGLLERESTGGAIARVGFEYQDAFVLQNLPRWLAQGAFSHVVTEGTVDVEVCYSYPGAGVRRLMIEAKNHTLTAPDFWEEIQRFHDVHRTAPEEFVRFALVCGGYNGKTNPFVEKLSRLRGVGASYQADSVVLKAGREEVVAWAVAQGQSDELAAFAFQHVDFVTYAAASADAAFHGELETHLPSVEITGKQASRLRDLYKRRIAMSSSGPVRRKELEEDLCSLSEDVNQAWLSTPVRISLDGTLALEQLSLDAVAFNGPTRHRKTPADWKTLSVAAGAVAAFVGSSTARRGVLLDGKQRMSTACLIGHAFAAVRGFTLRVEHNGNTFRTDRHEKSPGCFFSSSVRPASGQGGQGVVCIGFPTAVGDDVLLSDGGTLGPLACLALESTRALISNEDMNLAVAEAKTAMLEFRSSGSLGLLHLFVKAPSAFAMVLGHRLNGICQVQLYDWVDGAYHSTALLEA